MQLYPRAERIYKELEALGYTKKDAIPVGVLNQFDQLHYHGTDALDVAIQACNIRSDQTVLEVGSGWGGCSRYLAHASGARVTGVEIQKDYYDVARDLTARAGLSGRIAYQNQDFLGYAPQQGEFDHAVSWLALFHIPNRMKYLGIIHNSLKPKGRFFAEDLFLIKEPPSDEAEDFQRNLFPNSLTQMDDYVATMKKSGFANVKTTEMTGDWREFTAQRLDEFHQNREAYVAKHGEDGYRVIEVFYDKMAGYFARGIVGGLRVFASKG